LSLLKEHQKEASEGTLSETKAAVPMYIKLNQSVTAKSQTEMNLLYYSPSEIRSAYNATSLLDRGINGSGVTISIVDAYGDPYIQSELDNFSATFGIPTTTVHVVCVDGPCDYYEGIYTGWSDEIALDVEWAHAMAPGATINLYIGSNQSQPLFDAVAAAVAGTNGNGTFLSPSSIVSMSWGYPENDIGSSSVANSVSPWSYPWLDKVFQLGTAEGITFFASSGDSGAIEQTEGQTSLYGGANYPSTDPFVTGVGGTSLYMATTSGYLEYPWANATGTYGYETAWSWNDFQEMGLGWGTGGGFSTLFGQPFWQNGPGVATGEARGAPDVSWDGDPLTGVLVYYEGYLYPFGGTSVGSPSWAGAMALIDQAAGHSLGFINPSLYFILNNPSEFKKAIHDITVGDNDPYVAGPGWDPLTGVGTPNIGELASILAEPSTSLSVTATSNVTLGTSASYTSIQIEASVLNGAKAVTEGAGFAELTSNTEQLVANITMTYDQSVGRWTGTYQIQPTDPPGMWTATVHIINGSSSGTGATTFSVGDGITLFLPFLTPTGLYGPGPLYLVNGTIQVSAKVTGPGGSMVTSGSFNATFYLGSPAGAVEGNAPLAYNSKSGLWEGSFTIGPSVTQGTWVLSVTGTDSNGNGAAAAYFWLHVGPIAYTSTDSPTYVLGNTITIGSSIFYANSTYFKDYSTGSYSAEIWDYNSLSPHRSLIGTVALSYNSTYDIWLGNYTTAGQPAGFYGIVVTGSDGRGNYATGGTVIRVAPLTLDVSASVSPRTVLSTNATDEDVTASVRYQNGTLMTVGSVEAITGYGYVVPMTYRANTGLFSALLNITGLVGNFSVYVEAYDPVGNYQQEVLTFQVLAASSTSLSCGQEDIPLVTASSNPVLCTASVTGYYPTGEVDWSYSGTGSVSFNSTSCTLPWWGTCSVLLVGLSLGPVALEAAYTGDASNAPSNATLAVLVSPVEVSCRASQVVVGGSTKCTAKVAGSSNPAGTIVWSSDGPGAFSTSSCTLKKGACSTSYATTSAGNVNLTAYYTSSKAPNASYAGEFSLQVNQMTSKVSVSCSPRMPALVSASTVLCTAKLKGYFPTGNLTWMVSSTNGGNVSFSSPDCGLNDTSCAAGAGSNSVIVRTSGIATGPGTVWITAFYTGDWNNTYSYRSTELTVLRARPKLSVSCDPSSVNVGSSTTCTATLKEYYGSVVGESINWSKLTGKTKVSLPTTATCYLSAGGTCSIIVTGVSAGGVKIEAAYLGDFNNVGSQRTASIRVK
jgi:hypothetical protein